MLPAERVPHGDGFRWRLREETPLALLVCKVVRMASGIRAAMLLADGGYVTECACLLRIVSDLGTEVAAVAEGELRGEPTNAQRGFTEQFFTRPPVDSSSSAPVQKQAYVSREDLMKTHARLASTAGLDEDDLRNPMRALNFGYDGYVHGAYSTAMELYHGGRHQFMLRGHEGERRRYVYRVAVAGKLHEVIVALMFVAQVERDRALFGELREALKLLRNSHELTIVHDGPG